MNKSKAKSFTEVTFIEAIARHVRISLTAPEYLPGEENRLASYFLGIVGDGRIALAPPTSAEGEKVFLPVDCQLKMSFSLEDMWLQAATTVLEHGMHRRLPTRRGDALIVRQPTELLTTNRRGRPRKTVDPTTVFLATIWPPQRDLDTKLKPLQTGRVNDWSEGGLGILLTSKLELEISQMIIIGLDGPKNSERIFLWADLKHCTLCKTDVWLAGFGNLTNVRAGEAVNLMEFLSSTPD